MAMRHAIYILFSCLSFLVCATLLQAQTPYDSFAPEAYRPILELEEPQNPSPDTTILCAIFADFQNQKLLFVNVSNGEIITTASTTDDIHKWLTVDPLTDNYPAVSPYAYCGWNPIMFVDPDGRYSIENVEEGTYYKVIVVLPSEQVIDKMRPKDRVAFRDTYKQSCIEKMPTIRVDDAKDYVNAMAALEEMNTSTESYVLSTSHGYKNNGISALMIGSDVFTAFKGDFSQFSEGLNEKTMFITACSLAADKSGVDLLERFANATGATIIGAEYSVPALLGNFQGGSLSSSPLINGIYSLFGGYFENSYRLTNGENTYRVYGLTIDKNQGIRWISK